MDTKCFIKHLEQLNSKDKCVGSNVNFAMQALEYKI